MDNFFPLFTYLLIYRTEDAAGSNPAGKWQVTPPGTLETPTCGVF
jgi:hypothetical protein